MRKTIIGALSAAFLSAGPAFAGGPVFTGAGAITSPTGAYSISANGAAVFSSVSGNGSALILGGTTTGQQLVLQVAAQQAAIQAETTRAEGVEQTNAAAIASAGTAILAETSRAQAAESANVTGIVNETARAKGVEQANATGIASVGTAIQAETNRAQAAESTIGTTVATETARAKAAEALAPPSFLGQVATRGMFPNGFTASYTQFNSRFAFVMRSATPSFRVMVGNYWDNAQISSGNEETPSGGTATILAAIEYPAGTFTRITWNGNPSLSLSSGATALSDPIAVAIPKGAKAWFREFYSNPAGVVVRASSGAVFNAVDDPLQLYASGASDATMGQSPITQTTGQFASGPMATVAMTTGRPVCTAGDSRIEGIADFRNSVTEDGGEINRVLGKQAAYIELGGGYETARNIAQLTPIRSSVAHYCDVLIDEVGANDILAGASFASTLQNKATIDAWFSWGPVIGVTIAPYTTSNDNWKTASGQSTNSTIEPIRQSANSQIRAGLPGESGVIDIDRMIDPGATGLWPANGTANAYTVDGIHETNLGILTEDLSGYWSTASLGQ